MRTDEKKKRISLLDKFTVREYNSFDKNLCREALRREVSRWEVSRWKARGRDLKEEKVR